MHAPDGNRLADTWAAHLVETLAAQAEPAPAGERPRDLRTVRADRALALRVTDHGEHAWRELLGIEASALR